MIKTCTGSQYDEQHFQLAIINGWHGKYGHLNVLKIDHESSCTAYGKHDRIVAFCPEGDTGYARIDHVWGLGIPNDTAVIKHFKKHNNIRGNWIVTKREIYPCGKSTDIYLKRR